MHISYFRAPTNQHMSAIYFPTKVGQEIKLGGRRKSSILRKSTGDQNHPHRLPSISSAHLLTARNELLLW